MTANEKSILRSNIFKWLSRLFLIIIAMIMIYPLICETQKQVWIASFRWMTI